MSGDTYNKTFDLDNMVRQVNDSILWQLPIAVSFGYTAEYLTLLGNNGVLKNNAVPQSGRLVEVQDSQEHC